ncbi:transaldolase [Enemella dayhoffiae]|uniref:Transaldolase n=1 Tax=Enemella dayhoffiae TaxID=2016507 RepID=A0A255H7C9_9ACTN|nr:transaldolase [Enemella dayhoffiae]OYO23143.1 transaldolase [Enemella dayhoffiae]
MSDRLKKLSDAGVSIWLDDLSRQRISSGDLARLVAESSVTGVTTNPTIFAGALADGESYESQVRILRDRGVSVEDAIKQITTDDVRAACDVMSATNRATDGVDGRVSIEVEPGLARDTAGTIAQARELAEMVGRDNVLIKIPATLEGLEAITEVIGHGISVNVTLIFSLERYQGVMDAYLAGLEKAAEQGRDLSRLHSVASFFVSRVDSEVDKRLDKLGGEQASGLKGKAAVANARLAYELYQQVFESGERFAALKAKGANAQRPLWASTGVKDPAYPDTLYVADLIVPGTVNTMPEKTMDAFADHGEVVADAVTPHLDDARATMKALEEAGIDLDDVVKVLEDEGVEKFDKSWSELVETVKTALQKR